MKIKICILILAFLLTISSFGQTFSFNDTTFNVGDSLTTEVYFDFTPAMVSDVSLPFIDSLVQFLKINNKLKIEIASHTDDIGDEEANLTLSMKKSEVIIYCIVLNGMNERNLTAVGYGNSKPIFSFAQIEKMKTEHEKTEARRINRRTVFTIISTETNN